MTKIKILGPLGRKYTREFDAIAANPLQCIKAIDANFPGFRQYISNSYIRIYKVKPGKAIPISDWDDSSHKPMGDYSFVISPVIEGSGGVFKAILGGGLLLGATLFGGAALFPIGASLLLNGVSSLLSPKPKKPKESERNESFLTSASGKLDLFGKPVPVLYGTRTIQDPYKISESFTVTKLL